MAQWLGQFSGLTHATRLEDAQRMLRHAAAVFWSAGSDERAKKMRALRKLAQRVLRARLVLLKERLVAAERIPTAEAIERRAKHLDRLRCAHAEALAGGVDAVLVEFGVAIANQ